jgi:hypothetical protein
MLGGAESVFKGSPPKRFYQLIRTYFYEFYRIREIFYRFVKTLKVNNLIDKESAIRIKNLFHDAFQDTIAMRNSLVHKSVNWEGKNHINLHLVGGAHELGFMLLDK